MGFNGKRVLALESRRASETAELIRRQGGEAFVAPSLREAMFDDNPAAIAFGERLMNGEFDMVIFLTGVGCRALVDIIDARFGSGRFAEAIRKVTTVARGSKPAAVLREIGAPANILVPEPNTWRELLDAIEGRPEYRIAIQEYGRRNDELNKALEERGAILTLVPVYRYMRPLDLEPLREAVRRIIDGNVDVVLFTSSGQLDSLLETAEEMNVREPLLEGLARAKVASIGPTMTEALEEAGIEPWLQPSHPKLGILVKEAAEKT